MGRTRFQDQNCSIAQALDVLGDWWTLLIIRNAFFGMRRFRDFRKDLGISRNILSERLKTLVEHGVLEKVDVGRDGERFEYHLTDRGEALLPVLTSLREWGDQWVYGPGNEPMVMCDRETGERVPPMQVRSHDGRALTRRDLRARPGDGADARTLERFGRSRRS